MISYIYTIRIPVSKVKQFLRYMKAFYANWQNIQDEDNIFETVEDQWTFGEYETYQYVVVCSQATFLTNLLIDFLVLFNCPVFFCDRSEDPFSRKLEPWVWQPGMQSIPRHEALRKALLVFFMMRVNRVKHAIYIRYIESVQKRQIAKLKLDKTMDEQPF